jgi:hypothetical protein
MAPQEASVSKRLITLIVLVAVLGGAIGAYFIIKAIKAIPPKAPPETASARVEVDRFEVEKVQKMVLQSTDRTLTLVKKDGSWKIDVPYEVDVDQSKIEDIAYSFATMYAESVVEEKAADLAPYGLDKPLQLATAYLTDGTTRVYQLGNRTPTGNTYYLKPKDSQKVYAVWMNHGMNFSTTVTELRPKKMPAIDKTAITYIYLKWKGEGAIELQGQPQNAAPDPYVFGTWIMTKPYKQPRGVDGEKLQALMDSVSFSELKDFVADNVKDLAKYGLDPAEGEIFIKDATNSLHLLLGKNVDDYTTYFRYPNSKNVYTIERSSVDGFRKNAFDLADHFAFIVNIDWVDRIQIKHRDGRAYTVDVKREGKDEQGNWKSTFSLNGKVIADTADGESPFRKFYQTIIGVLLDGEATKEVRGDPVATITYTLAAEPTERRKAQTVKLEFLDYNGSFYLVRRDGVGEFVTAKNRDLEKILSEAQTLSK